MVDRQPSPDEQRLLGLLERAGAGEDPAAAEEARRLVDALFVANEPRLFHACLRYLGDPETAREVTHDVLLTAYHRLGEFRGEGSFFSFLYGIAKFTCFNALRRRRDLLADDGLVDPTDPASGPATAIGRAERLELLRQASAAVLDPIEQEAVYLRYDRGLGQDEIGRILGLTGASGGRGLLQRCRRKLAAEIARLAAERGDGGSWLEPTR